MIPGPDYRILSLDGAWGGQCGLVGRKSDLKRLRGIRDLIYAAIARSKADAGHSTASSRSPNCVGSAEMGILGRVSLGHQAATVGRKSPDKADADGRLGVGPVLPPLAGRRRRLLFTLMTACSDRCVLHCLTDGPRHSSQS